MPPFSVGVAQVEERLRTLRRRLNLFALQDAIYLAGATLAVAAALLLVLAVRGQAMVFAVTFWATVAAVVVAVIGSALRVRSRWLSAHQTIHLADNRAALEDRLATLLLVRTDASSLRDLLLEQTLAASPRWDVDTLAPRRVPYSAALLGAALAALIVTAYFVRAPAKPIKTAALQPPSRQTWQNDEPDSPHPQQAHSSAQLSGAGEQPSSGSLTGGGGAGTLSGTQSANGERREAQGKGSGDGHATQRNAPPAQSPEGQPRLPEEATADSQNGGAPTAQPQSGTAKLQDAIRGALGADALPRSRDQNNTAPPRTAATEPQPHSADDGAPLGERSSKTKPSQSDPQDRNQRGAPGGTGSLAGRGSDDSDAQLFGSDSNVPGKARPSQNLALKLAAFSSLASSQSESQPPAPLPGVAASAGTGAPHAVSDEQIPDGPVRKGEVAPEHEALVRRIFTRDE